MRISDCSSDVCSSDLATVRLSADLAGLDADQKKMLALLIEAADVTNALYWRQNWGDRDALLARIDDPQQRAFAELNYGPWDRLHDDQSFVAGIGPRPAGAQFYTADMSKAEFERSGLADKRSDKRRVRKEG